MSSNTFQSDDILDGIHPKTTELDDQKKANTKENYYGIPADILDGIYPKDEYNQEVTGEDKFSDLDTSIPPSYLKEIV